MAETKIRQFGVVERLGKMDVDIVTVTPTIETSTIDANDVLFNPVEITNAVSVPGGRSLLHSICLIDQTNTAVDAGVSIDLVFTQDSTALGTLDAAVDCADTVLDGILGIINIGSGSYVDMINGQIATKSNVGLTLIGASTSSQSVYVGGVIRETGTVRDADAIDIRLGIIKD
tara:strand:+ start:242 stop:760 length:519 start_codon:yes stop_codon:yes gene_type:complete